VVWLVDRLVDSPIEQALDSSVPARIACTGPSRPPVKPGTAEEWAL
jgi:hypothetical protein